MPSRCKGTDNLVQDGDCDLAEFDRTTPAAAQNLTGSWEQRLNALEGSLFSAGTGRKRLRNDSRQEFHVQFPGCGSVIVLEVDLHIDPPGTYSDPLQVEPLEQACQVHCVVGIRVHDRRPANVADDDDLRQQSATVSRVRAPTAALSLS